MNLKTGVLTFVVTALFTLTGCGPPTSPPQAVTIGSAGGTVSSPAGAQVVIPAGALTQDTAIGVGPSDATAPALPAGVTAFGQSFALTPHGTAFAQPVTISVPFDPGNVPAGTVPVLMKTNAARNGWNVVPGATVNGNLMTGQITGFSDTVVSSPPLTPTNDPLRFWQFWAYPAAMLPPVLLEQGDQEGGLVNVQHDYGANPFAPDGKAFGEVHSSEDGKTYWVMALGPKSSNVLDPNSEIGSQVFFNQSQTFRKDAADATLKLIIPVTTLQAFNFNPVDEVPPQCVDVPLTIGCTQPMWASVSFTVQALRLPDLELLLDQSSEVSIGGDTVYSLQHGPVWYNDVHKRTPYGMGRKNLWSLDSFNFDLEGTEASATLKKPTVITVDLSKVAVGQEFNLQVWAEAETYNEIQRESFVAAFFRDPQSASGSTVEFSGLTPTRNQPPPPPAPVQAPVCSTGADPAAGTLAFSAPSYAALESQAVLQPVLVTRTGGSTNEVSVRVRSGDGSAHAGQDFAAVDTVVYFADGETAPAFVSVPVTLDTSPEPDKSLTLTLSDARGCAALGAQSSATVTILDNDHAPPVPQHTLGGTVSGLQGSGLVLQDKARFNQLQVNKNGSFTFVEKYDENTAYDVQVLTQPSNPIQICTVTNGQGTVTNADVSNIAVNCVNQAQTPGLDPTFGSGGKATVPSSPTEVMALQPDGKIIMAGGVIGSFRMTRVGADSSLDTAFGAGGTVNTDFPGTVGTQDDNAHAVAVQPDGKIILVGEAVSGLVSGSSLFNSDFALARYNPDGTLDTTFGAGGLVTSDLSGNLDSAHAVALQSDGKIVVAGDVFTPKGLDFALVRYNADGTLDASFGSGGKVTTDLSGSTDEARQLVIQQDGRIVVAGPVAQPGSGGLENTGLARYNPDGSPDTSFGPGGAHGIVTLISTGVSNDLALQADGKLVLAGSVFSGVSLNNTFLLIRLNADGSLDNGFGSGGRVTTDFGPFIDTASALAVQADGKIIAAGTVNFASPAAGGSDFALARYNANGTPDSTFGTAGTFTVDFFGAADSATGVAVRPDGKIVVGGFARNGSSGGIGLARINP